MPHFAKSFNDLHTVEVELDHVKLAILPEELMGQREFQKLRQYRPGFGINGLSDIGVVGRINDFERVIQPQPIALRNVSCWPAKEANSRSSAVAEERTETGHGEFPERV